MEYRAQCVSCDLQYTEDMSNMLHCCPWCEKVNYNLTARLRVEGGEALPKLAKLPSLRFEPVVGMRVLDYQGNSYTCTATRSGWITLRNDKTHKTFGLEARALAFYMYWPPTAE